MWWTRLRRTLEVLLTACSLLMLCSACGVPQVLTTSLPGSAGTVSVGTQLSQPFLSPSNGLDGVTVAVSPPLGADGELVPQPTGGATVSVRYAPEADNRFPEGAFHDWPDRQKWLPELTGDQQIGQSFLSRYPNLGGITLRVATFGADSGTGPATLKPGNEIDVRSLPVDGKQVRTVPGGSRVTVTGTAEGWAHVTFSDGADGYIALDQFATLPPAPRHNTANVTLTLYREGDMAQLRQATINAADMHDNSHVTFTFDPIADSNGQRFRLVVTSPASSPGNAVTFRYDPTSTYADGQRFDGGQPAEGALVFRPEYAASSPLFQTNVDDLEWSSLTRAFIGGFSPRTGTADRFLSVDLTPGTRTLNVQWSLIRPSGGQPVVVDGNSQSPGGGLVFNMRYRNSVSVSGIAGDAARAIGHDGRQDPAFFALYALALTTLVLLLGWTSARVIRHGR